MTLTTSSPRKKGGSAELDNDISSTHAQPEYSVYIHHHDEHGAPQQWERKHNTLFVDQAIKRAKVLHRSDKYAKVEVKKVEMHARKKQPVERCCKVYKASMMRQNVVMFVLLTLGAIAIGVFLYALL